MFKALREWWTGIYESEPMILGQPFGANTTVVCRCGLLLSTKERDWVRIEERRTFETICPRCGPVEGGGW